MLPTQVNARIPGEKANDAEQKSKRSFLKTSSEEESKYEEWE